MNLFLNCPAANLKILEKALTKFPDLEVSNNPNLTPAFVEKYSYLKWDFYCLARNHHFKYEDFIRIFKRFPDKCFSCLVNIDEEFILTHLDKFCLNISEFSSNPGVSIEFILAHPEIKWCWRSVSRRKDLKISYVIQNPSLPWNFYGLTMYTEYENIERYPDLPWEKTVLHYNKSLPRSIYRSLPETEDLLSSFYVTRSSAIFKDAYDLEWEYSVTHCEFKLERLIMKLRYTRCYSLKKLSQIHF